MCRSNPRVGRRALLLLAAAAAICCGGRFAEALSCMCNSMSRCEKPTDCGAGLVLDACSCCYECARTANETCGGLFHLHGTCANGLYCETAPDRVDDGSVAAAPAEVQPGICVPCKGPMRYGCDAIDGHECQCGKSCTKEFRFDSLETCRAAVRSRQSGGPKPDTGQLMDGSEQGATPTAHDSLPDFPPDEPSCLDVSCPDDRELFVECPSDSWRRPLPEPALFEVCCGIHGLTDECVCKELHSCPAPPMCDEGLLPVEVITADGKPGSCCSLYQCANVTSLQCEFKGVWYEHGDEVPPASLAAAGSGSGGGGSSSSSSAAAAAPDSPIACQSCFCLEGQVLCQQTVECLPVPSTCSWMAVADGECCPTCRGCVSQSTLAFHAVGESWQEDDCTSCECDVDGVPRCFASACVAPRCARPLKVPGHCCPVCSGDSEGTASAAVDDGGRIDVVTFGGADNVSNGTTPTTAPTMPASTNAAVSAGVAPAATTPSAAPSGGCARLDCSTACDEARGERQELDSNGCPTCRCGSTSGLQLPTASTSPQPDKATHGARLQDSTTVTATPAVADSSGNTRCFTSLGHPRHHGETWFDGCRECICDNGRELCSLVACPPPLCRHPVLAAGQCCPVCPEYGDQQMTRATNITSGCRSAVGIRRRVGTGSLTLGDGGDALEENRESWRLDACSVCICHQGHALCETERCPPILCEKPVYNTGRCCPTCPDSQYWPASITALPTYRQGCTALGGGRTYRHGDVWRASDCQSCTCQHGQLHCYSQTCPAAISTGITVVAGGSSCTSAVSRKGQCCPICTADAADIHHRVCIINDQVFLHGQEWTTACLLCVCYHGSRHCAPRPCSQLRTQMVGCGSPSSASSFTTNDALPTNPICCQHCLDASRDGVREPAEPATPGGSGGEMAVMATLAALLCLFAGVIVALVIVVVRRTRRRSGSATLSSVVPELLSVTGGSGGGAGGTEMLAINNRPAADSAAALRAVGGGGVGGVTTKRPKSTNLEFYVGSFRYNNTALKDKECCKPLVDGGSGGNGGSRTRNEYVLC